MTVQKLNNILKDPRTNWKYIALVSILAFIAGAIIMNCLSKTEVGFEIPQITFPERKVEEDETKDWKTYRNEEYGFEIKYPLISDWEISKEIDTPLVVQFGPEWCITVFEYAKNPQNLNVKEFCEEQYKNITLEEAPFGDDPCWHILYKEPELLNMEDKEALQVKRVGGPLATTVTLIDVDNFILAISKIESDYTGYEAKCGLLNSDKVYNQILSTFRFIE